MYSNVVAHALLHMLWGEILKSLFWDTLSNFLNLPLLSKATQQARSNRNINFNSVSQIRAEVFESLAL